MESSTSLLADAEVLVAGTREWVGPLVRALEAAGTASVETTTTVETVLAAVSEASVDCVVTGRELADGTGVELVEAVRERTATLPVVVSTDVGTERVASEAVGAGATDYVALSEATAPESVVDRVALAVREARRTETLRDRAKQFEAIFRDSQTATWVLDPEGLLQRANATAREMVGEEITALAGEPFWTLPWWTGDDQTRADVRRVTRKATRGESTDGVVTRYEDDESRMLELTVLPVHDPRGTLVAILVHGSDVTERVSLYRELRESEQLHRVTLNNMTDTVLITDESGAFTYVCPNVNYVFGYSAEEIREFGTIDRLLGEDLFDRSELAETGVLTNIETRATDKAGEEHVLLVNVREVDIQDGTLLFSCRDVTKRKRREEALTTIQETTRRLQYAETEAEVAHVLVEDVPEILDTPASLVALHDPEDDTLRPAAYSDRMAELHDPASDLPVDEETLLGYSFLNKYPRFYDDVRDAERLRRPTTDLRSTAVVPIGDHGLLMAGSGTPGAFDKVTRELTDLVAATAEAAFDRVERDGRLRRKDRKLQRQNEQLQQVNDLNDIVRDIDQALVQAETRSEVDQTVCDALTDGTDFSFAWIGELSRAGDRVEPTAWAGDDRSYLEAVPLTVDEPGGDPASRTARTQSVTAVSNVASDARDEGWRRAALRRGYQSVLSVPLLYDELQHGVLTVYADDPEMFDDRVQDTLAELGATIASAISGLNRKNALLTAGGTRLEFETRDRTFPLLRLAERAGAAITFEGGVQQTDAGVVLFVTVAEAATDALVEAVDRTVPTTGVEVLNRGEAESLLRLELSQPFLAVSLADHGAVLRRAVADETTAELVVDVPANNDTSAIVRQVRDTLAETELVAKYSEDRTPTRELYATFLDRLTERQLEVVKTAYYSGYFESPRERSGEEVAATLGISPPAFYEHTRTVQRKLFATLFDEIGVPVASVDR